MNTKQKDIVAQLNTTQNIPASLVIVFFILAERLHKDIQNLCFVHKNRIMKVIGSFNTHLVLYFRTKHNFGTWIFWNNNFWNVCAVV